MKDFDSLTIQPAILQNIRLLGFEEMTPIQGMALPPALEGKDIIGQAKTGTGKTLSFAIPLIEKIRLEDRFVQALVLTPTRELAVQVGLEFEKLAGSGVRVALTYGGASINSQIDLLRRGVHVVVGTPGRVIDHLKRGTLRIDRVETLVLDEADRMLDMGFIQDVEWIIEKTPRKRQTMLFSATIPDEIRRLAERYMRSPEFVSVNSDNDELTVDEVQQFYVEVDQKEKMDAFFKVAKEERPSKALVFCKTKKWVEVLYGILKRRGFSVDRIHGDLTQAARKKAIERLRQGKIKYLICTDVVARGIDISDISHVFNYDIPQEPLTYVHRIGRTARIGKKGTAITFISPSQIHDLWLIEHRARTKIHERKLSK
ncbi:MAG: DEAD/DEAH box helicase [Candidatus Altiarchaeota archaeon]|nr:DEAD/DEAH box helicase [Candidatus Altiarchaeota archaeon]